MYDLTVIIPTFNEEANIRNIVMAVDAVFHENSLHGQILVVDDNSSDATISIVQELKRQKENVDILVREKDHGLSQSVADGFTHAASDVFIVIDADFSHPPVLIPRMYDEIRKGNDIVIGSRYMEGGEIKNWPLKRRFISIGATLLGRMLFPDITDPVSGFFAVRKQVVQDAPLKPRGYKILLEVLEVPLQVDALNFLFLDLLLPFLQLGLFLQDLMLESLFPLIDQAIPLLSLLDFLLQFPDCPSSL